MAWIMHLDVLVFATGFETTEWHWSLDVTGRDGIRLSEAWKDGPEAYLGLTVSGFPNLFMLYGPNTNLGHNSITFMLERQSEYITQALVEMERRGFAAIEPLRDVQDRFNREQQAALAQHHLGRSARQKLVYKRSRAKHAELAFPHSRLRGRHQDRQL